MAGPSNIWRESALRPQAEQGGGDAPLTLHQRRQAVQAVAEIDRPARHHDAHPGRDRDHASSRTICSTRRKSPSSNPVPRRIVIPPAITSILPLAPPTAGRDPVGEANVTGTNPGIAWPISAARLRN